MTQETQMFLAKALYDNVAETPDELAFRRGDVITVLDQDTGGLEGWWLCSLRGRQGIAPGNRLKILSGMTEGGGEGSSSYSSQDCDEWQKSLERASLSQGKRGDVYLGHQSPQRSMEDYDVPPSRHQRSHSSKEPSPEPGNDIYDTPTNLTALRNATHGNNNSSSSNSLYATPSGSRQASCERTPPGSQRASMDSLSSGSSFSHRLSADSAGHPHHFQTLPATSRRPTADSRPRRLSERLHETPPGSKRASAERTLGGVGSGDDDQPIYDTPSPAARPLEVPGECTYDTPSPSSGSRRQSRDDSLGRASMLSSASSESCTLSGSASNLLAHSGGSKAGGGGGGGSLPDSARSSLDASLHDGYLPTREGRALTQLSLDSGLGLYDAPAATGRQQPPSPQPAHVPGSVFQSQLADLAGAGDRQQPSADLKRSHSVEHALDDIYDCPRNNAPKVPPKPEAAAYGSRSGAGQDPNAVYDVPPQVTRDSVISARSDSSSSDGDSLRLSSCSSDSRGSGPEYGGGVLAEGPTHEELLLDLDSALEVLVKRQQDVTRASSRVLAFVTSPAWRSKESLQTNLMDLRMACGELRKALGEFADFAQGAAANALHLSSDRKLSSRLMKQLGPLQQQRKSLTAAVRSLEDGKWQVALLADPPECEAQDDLGAVVSLARDMVPPVKKLASFIQGNGAALFKRAPDLTTLRRGSDDSHVVSKPPIGPRSELLPKPGAGGNGVGVVIQRPRSVQQRPLPAPPLPLSERPLPPTPLQQKLRDLELAGALDNLDYINVEGMRRDADDDDGDNGDRDYSDLLQQDYDYVQIDSCDAEAQQRRKDRQGQRDCQEDPKTPTPDSLHFGGEDDRDVTVNGNHHTTDMVNANSPHTNEDMDLALNQEADSSEEDLKTPMNKTNGFTIPDIQQEQQYGGGYSSGYVDLSQTSLSANDKQVLVYYSGQLETHSTLLNNAIDAFLTCVQSHEPPKVFISNSKFVIVTAHKLVYIGDALHRSLCNGAVRNKVMQCANHVCQCLKLSVQATKTAALQYPSPPALQDMVDRVVDVSHAAHELKLVITQASAL